VKGGRRALRAAQIGAVVAALVAAAGLPASALGAAPIVTADAPSVTAEEGTLAVMSGSFSDADGDGMLSSGDTFMIQRQSGGPWRYLLLVFFKPRDAGAVAPCPCAAGRWEFPVP